MLEPVLTGYVERLLKILRVNLIESTPLPGGWSSKNELQIVIPVSGPVVVHAKSSATVTGGQVSGKSAVASISKPLLLRSGC